MEYYTKSERNTIYKEALVVLQKLYDTGSKYRRNYGICHALNVAARNVNLPQTSDITSETCPEIYKQKPKNMPNNGGYWFGFKEIHYQRRVCILKIAIEQTKEIKNEI